MQAKHPDQCDAAIFRARSQDTQHAGGKPPPPGGVFFPRPPVFCRNTAAVRGASESRPSVAGPPVDRLRCPPLMYLWGIDMASAFVLHLLSAVVWVGGMFFAYMALRPAAVDVLEPPLRLRLWVRVVVNFFPWVWTAVVTLLLTGYGMLFAFFGGLVGVLFFVFVLFGVGLLLLLFFGFVFFVLFRCLFLVVVVVVW